MESKQERLRQQTLVKLYRTGLLSYPRPRFRSIGPTMAQLGQHAQQERRIDILSGLAVSEIEARERREKFADRAVIPLEIPDRCFRD